MQRFFSRQITGLPLHLGEQDRQNQMKDPMASSKSAKLQFFWECYMLGKFAGVKQHPFSSRNNGDILIASEQQPPQLRKLQLLSRRPFKSSSCDCSQSLPMTV